MRWSTIALSIMVALAAVLGFGIYRKGQRRNQLPRALESSRGSAASDEDTHAAIQCKKLRPRDLADAARRNELLSALDQQNKKRTAGGKDPDVGGPTAVRRDPVRVWNSCLRLVTLARDTNRDVGGLRACVGVVQVCSGADGEGDCCPRSCVEAFKEMINGGATEDSAVSSTFLNGDCVPGFLTKSVRSERLTRDLQNAVAAGDANRVRELVDEHANVNDRTGGATLLAIAASHGDANVLGILIRAGAVVDERGPVGTTPLWEAAAAGKLDAVRVLLEVNADVNARSADGRTPLIAAIERGASDVVGLLISRGADVRVADSRLHDALWHAHARGDARIIQLVTRDHSQAEQQANVSGALRQAVSNGAIAQVKALLDANADVNQADSDGNTPLHWAAMSGQAAVAALLLEYRADVGRKNRWGGEPLTLAITAAQTNVATVQLLVRAGGDVHSEQTKEAFLKACAGHHADIVRLLLSAGLDPNAATWPGYTALMRAAASGDRDVVLALLRAGADIGRVNPQDHMTARMYAEQKRHFDVVQLLTNTQTR